MDENDTFGVKCDRPRRRRRQSPQETQSIPCHEGLNGRGVRFFDKIFLSRVRTYLGRYQVEMDKRMKGNDHAEGWGSVVISREYQRIMILTHRISHISGVEDI